MQELKETFIRNAATLPADFAAVLRAGAANILQPALGRSGGIWETKKIAVMCELFNAQIAPHIYCGPVAHAAAMHVGFSSPAFLILETIHSDFHTAVLQRPLSWEEGFMVAPTEPGLGIELNDAVVAAHPYTTGGRLHLEMSQTPLSSDNRLTVNDL